MKFFCTDWFEWNFVEEFRWSCVYSRGNIMHFEYNYIFQQQQRVANGFGLVNDIVELVAILRTLAFVGG